NSTLDEWVSLTLGTNVFKTYAVKFIPTVDNPFIGVYAGGGSAGKTINVDGVRLFEVSSADYAKIDVDPEWTGEKLAEKFPYVDSVQHVQGVSVRKTGKILLAGLPDILHANA